MKAALRAVWSCVVLLALVSLSKADQQTRTLVAFGDSTTAPRGELIVYSKLLQEELPGRGMPVRVINAGVGGNNTEPARARFARERDPEMVVVEPGRSGSR